MNKMNNKNVKGITLISLVITIVIMLILAAVTINLVIGDNGLFSKSTTASNLSKQKGVEEKLELMLQEYKVQKEDTDGKNLEDFLNDQKSQNKLQEVTKIDDKMFNIKIDGYNFEVNGESLTIGSNTSDDNDNKEEVEDTTKIPDTPAPGNRVSADPSTSNWYDYGATVNAPKLIGHMTPITYDGTVTGKKWANAVTADGSMFVWIPRYAYKITSKYHISSKGTIEIKFIDVNNNFLDGTKGKPETDPTKITYTNDCQNEWLVHPAFTASAENGGGFGELSGIWVGKFETTGTADNLSVKPGVTSLRNQDVSDMWNEAKDRTIASFGETINLKQHMVKNSEWGAILYLTHSVYGINGGDLARNVSDGFYTGDSTDLVTIYSTNTNHSSTYNPYGVYDLYGGAWEYTASYVATGEPVVTNNGKEMTESAQSTEYVTVYPTTFANCKNIKGDAIYETSNNGATWNLSDGKITYGGYPSGSSPFFTRGSYSSGSNPGLFYYFCYDGTSVSYVATFRMCLAF